MGNVVNRKAPAGNPSYAEYHVLLSVNTPDYPSSQWIVNPLALLSLIGNGTTTVPQTPKKYWIVDPPASNVLREMTPAEKAIVDQAELGPLKAERKALLTQAAQSYLDSRYPPEVQTQLLNLRPTATGLQLQGHVAYLAWYRSVHTGLLLQTTAVDNATSSAQISAITFDPAPFTASDPLFHPQMG